MKCFMKLVLLLFVLLHLVSASVLYQLLAVPLLQAAFFTQPTLETTFCSQGSTYHIKPTSHFIYKYLSSEETWVIVSCGRN